MANSASGDSVIDRVVRILAAFDGAHPRLTVSEVARRSGLPSSTAHRLARDLVGSGLLDRGDDGTVQVGMRLWELTTRGSRALGLRQAALPLMTVVQAAIRQHTQLAVREHDEALFLERLSLPDAGANITRIAGRLPLHASSSGLVLLANAPAPDIERILAGELDAISAETIVDPAELRRLLARVRRQGFVVAAGSIESVSTGIAVPVRDAAGEVVAALSVVVPRDFERVDEAVRVLRRAADGITRAIGEQPPLYR